MSVCGPGSNPGERNLLFIDLSRAKHKPAKPLGLRHSLHRSYRHLLAIQICRILHVVQQYLEMPGIADITIKVDGAINHINRPGFVLDLAMAMVYSYHEAIIVD